MNVIIQKGTAVGTVAAPPSKSMAHRLLICGGFADGTSIIRGISRSQDVMATLDCLSALGVRYRMDGDDVALTGIDARTAAPSEPLCCRESGSTMRFFVPLLLISGHPVTLTGAPSLLRRPMSVYETLCAQKGLSFQQDGQGVSVCGPLMPGEYTLAGNVSSQFISGLLFALPLLEANSTIRILPPVESRPYLNLTIQALASFGVEAVWQDEHTLFLRGGQRYQPCGITVEGDYSNAAFFAALKMLGGQLEITGLDPESLQGDKIYQKYFEMLAKGTPTIHIGDCPDLGPILFAVAAAKNGGIFTGTSRLRLKESDRCSAMAQELQKFGTAVTVYENTVVVYPREFHRPCEVLSGHNDHRIVMALSVLLTLTGGELAGAQAADKSYPGFFAALRKLGIEVKEYGA